MKLLNEVLPFLVFDLESALSHMGRGDIVVQLREVAIERWTYNEMADVAYLHLRSPRGAGAPGEPVSVHYELGITLDTDSGGSLTGMEITSARQIAAQLGEPDQLV